MEIVRRCRDLFWYFNAEPDSDLDEMVTRLVGTGKYYPDIEQRVCQDGSWPNGMPFSLTMNTFTYTREDAEMSGVYAQNESCEM